MSEQTRIGNILSGLQHFVSLQGKALQLRYYRTVTESLLSLVSGAVFFSIGILAALFFGLAMAWKLGDVIDSRAGGFVLTGFIFTVMLVTAMLLFKARRSGLASQILYKVSDARESDYRELSKKEKDIQAAAEKQRQLLVTQLEELQASIRNLEMKFGPVLDSGQDTAGKGTKAEILGDLAGFVLNTFILPKAGIVKRTVLPLVAKALLKSRLVREGKGAGLFQRVKGLFR